MITSKINVYQVIRDHLSTLSDKSSETYDRSDIFWFTFVPIIIASIYSILVEPTFISKSGRVEGVDSITIASFSIFCALLFNLQMLVFSSKLGNFRERNKSESTEQYEADKRLYDRKSKFIEQLFYNISYLILVSVAIIVIGLVSIIFFDSKQQILNFIKILLIFNFIFTLLMCLKRIHALFKV